MTGAGEPSKGRSHKRKRIDYLAIANQHAASLQEQDPLSKIRRKESLDSYARLQSLIHGMLDHFFVSNKAKLCLDIDSYSSVTPLEYAVSGYPTESYPTTHDVDDLAFDAPNVAYNLFESLSLPSWKEIGLPGHGHLSRDDADDLGGSPCDLDSLLTDTLGDDTAYGEYESGEDDSDEILERLQESVQSSEEDNARNAIGNVKCLYVSGFHSALG